MKKIISIFFLITIFITPYSCKKKDTVPDKIKQPVDTIVPIDSDYIRFLDTMSNIYQMEADSNYSLKNKPLDTIRKYINGKWKLRFIYGGFTPNKIYLDHVFYEFMMKDNYQDSIKFFSDENSDFSIKKLIWDRNQITNIDSSYKYYFNPGSGITNPYKIIEALRNDTLITEDDANEGNLNLFTRVR